jgi:hypothetical protein
MENPFFKPLAVAEIESDDESVVLHLDDHRIDVWAFGGEDTERDSEARRRADYLCLTVNNHETLVAHVRHLAKIVDAEFPEEDERYAAAQAALKFLETL